MLSDSITQERLDVVFPDLAASWREVQADFFKNHSLQLRVACGTRTFAEQWAVYSLGRTKGDDGIWVITDIKKVVTYAQPGLSFHQYGLAIDSIVFGQDPYLAKLPKADSDALWLDYGATCKKHGLVWGGDWSGSKNDRPHCENSYGLTIHDVQMIYEKGGVDAVWDKCRITADCGREIEE